MAVSFWFCHLAEPALTLRGNLGTDRSQGFLICPVGFCPGTRPDSIYSVAIVRAYLLNGFKSGHALLRAFALLRMIIASLHSPSWLQGGSDEGQRQSETPNL